MTSSNSEPVFACNLSAIPKEHRAEHDTNARQLFAAAQEVRTLPLGYAWRFPNEMETFQYILAFVNYERLCCPFFHFRLDIEPEQGPVWLQITGSRDIKPFAQSEGWFVS